MPDSSFDFADHLIDKLIDKYAFKDGMKEIADFKEPLEIGDGGFAEKSPGVILHDYDFSNID